MTASSAREQPVSLILSGPAVISEHTATTVIHAADTLRVGRHGEMVITVGTQERA
jgi:N-methylhydantoinase A